MAKYPHRVFEMYDYLEEAVRAIKPEIATANRQVEFSKSSDFMLLEAAQSESVTRVRFKRFQSLTDDTAIKLRRDLAKLSGKLDIGSKVLFDFSELSSIPPESIDFLVSFNKNLRHKGGRVVLCCLDAAVRENFFRATKSDDIY